MTPVAPAGPKSWAESFHEAGLMSKWAKGVSPAKWAKNAPAVMHEASGPALLVSIASLELRTKAW